MEVIDKNEKRRRMQADVVRSVIDDKYVIVNWGTGVGKSRVGIGAVEEMFRRGAYRILLLVDQTFHKDNWLKEFMDCKGEEHGRRLYESLTVECYASLPKYVGTEWDLIVADEAHHLRGDNRIQLLSSMKAERILCLSATVSCNGDGEGLLMMLNTNFGIFRSFDFGVQAAIDTGILAEPTIHIHVLPLAEMSAHHVIEDGWGKEDRKIVLKCGYDNYKNYLNAKRYPAARLLIDCTVAQAYEYYSRQFEVAEARYKKLNEEAKKPGSDVNPNTLKWAMNRYVQYGGLRKKLLGEAKTVFSRALIEKKKGHKFLCFCADVEQAIELGGENVIFADRKDRLGDICLRHGIESPRFKTNKEVVEAFNNGEIRSLFAINMIQEGQNLAGIETGITIQLAGKDRQFIQKFGRTLRSEKPEQHIVVVDSSKDVDYLKDSLAEINPRYFVFHGYGSLKGKIKCMDDIREDPAKEKKREEERKANEQRARSEALAASYGGLFGNG